MSDRRTELGFERTVCDCKACKINCEFIPGFLLPSDIRRIALHLGYSNPVEFALDKLLASPGAIVVDRGQIRRIRTLAPARREDGACLFLDCDLKQKMASGGSKRWRASYPESTTYEMLPRPGWKH